MLVITISCRSEIEECPDQDTSKMQAKLSIVPIDQLSLFIGKKVSSACTCSSASQLMCMQTQHPKSILSPALILHWQEVQL